MIMDEWREAKTSSCEVEQNGIKEFTKTSSMLKCTFCKTVLIAPVTLRCLHSLCKPCLMRLMEENNGADTERFALKCNACNCLKCLEYDGRTHNFKEQIIKSLSPPKVILTLLDFCKQNQEPVCTPCRNRGKSTASMYWCFDCVVYLCDECFLFHSSLPILGNHKTYKREEAAEITALLPSARDVCDRHGLSFNRVCKLSGKICCDTCISFDHIDVCSGEHKDISEIAGMVDPKLLPLKISIRALLDEIRTNVTRNSEVESMIAHFFQDNLNTLNKQIDAVEKNFLEKTDLLLAESFKIAYFKLQEIESNSISLQRKKCVLENARSIISVFQGTSGIRSFLEKKKVNNTLTEVQAFVDNVKEEEVLDISIYFDTSLKGLFDLATFGNFRKRQSADLLSSENHTDTIQEKPNRISRWASEINILQGKENLGFMKRASSEMNLCVETSNKSYETETMLGQCSVSSSMKSIQFGGRTYILSISLNIENGNSHVTGCDWKSDDELILVDAAARGRPEARIYNIKEGKFKQNIPLTHKPYDVAVLPDDKFVITFPKEEKLLIGSFNDLSAKRFVDVPIHCYGVCHWRIGTTIIAGKENIVFCGSDFSVSKTLIVKGEDVRYVCAYNNNLIFYSDLRNNKVFSIVGNGDNRFTYDSDIKGPAGLILDEHKNVYICEKASEYLHVLDKGGTFLRKFEVGKNPTAISLSKDRTKLCIIRGGRNMNNVADIYVSN